MNKMQLELDQMFQELQKEMNLEISKFSNIKRKGFMGENVAILDFAKKDFPQAKIIASEIKNARVNIYDKNNRISLIF